MTSQIPFEQMAVPNWAGGGHAVGQVPQWLTSVLKLTHVPAHVSGKALLHANAQALFVQTAVPLAVGGGQTCPQVWQFNASFAKLTQSPLQME
jgi:hypothetical protein